MTKTFRNDQTQFDDGAKKTVSQPSSARQPDYLKWLLFAIIGLMILVVTYGKILFYMSDSTSAFKAKILSIRVVLVPHIVFPLVPECSCAAGSRPVDYGEILANQIRIAS